MLNILTIFIIISIAASFNLISSTYRQNFIESLPKSTSLHICSNPEEGITPKMNLVNMELDWISMDKFRRDCDSNISAISCPENTSRSTQRLAKDEAYARAVLDAWQREANKYSSNDIQTIGAKLEYRRRSDDKSLAGYLVTNKRLLDSNQDQNHMAVPVVILFHTGAGPQDIFLRWKADSIARDKIWGDNGCIVFIADILSDSIGWTWQDRIRYDDERLKLLEYTQGSIDGALGRWYLRESISAIFYCLEGINQVDKSKIGAIGWCMGGHPILELSTMDINGVKALITFHGVFDGVSSINATIDNVANEIKSHVLVCNGKSDPFVSQESVEMCKAIMENHSCKVEVLNLENVRHGFSNPAQDFNPSESFAFDQNAANLSWKRMRELLQKQLTT